MVTPDTQIPNGQTNELINTFRYPHIDNDGRISFVGAWKRRLGLITMADNCLTTYIQINSLLRFPEVPEHVATIQGPGLRIAENRLLKRLAREKIVLGSLRPGKSKRWPLDEEVALTLGLLFRVLAPMTFRSRRGLFSR